MAQASCDLSAVDRTVTGSENLNTYYPSPVSAVTTVAGAMGLPVDIAAVRGPDAIAAGDLVLIVQVQGATIDTRNQSVVNGEYGDGAGGNDRQGVLATSPFGVGAYEWNIASGVVTGGEVPLVFPTANTYTSTLTVEQLSANVVAGFRRYQAVRVPGYRNLTVPGGATLTGLPWNGRSGGIVSVDVSELLDVQGTIDATGLGFRGGTPIIPCPLPGPSECDNPQVSRKGEGIVGTGTRVYSRSLGVITGLAIGIPGGDSNRGAPGNAGGTPEGDADSGGGGGGGGGMGGTGAIGPGAGSVATEARGGDGYQDVNRIVMGGGGGSGSLDDRTAVDAVSGQAGGGVIYLRVTQIMGNGTIRSNGDGGATQPQEGGGGGGGGGTVFIRTHHADIGSVTIEALGGDGASTVLANDGAGGGGGGGFVVLANPAGGVTATVDVSGGAGGTGGGGSGTSSAGGEQLDVAPATSNCPGLDSDGDRINDFADEDDDNDGILDSVETAMVFGASDPGGDDDHDGVPNYLDADTWASLGMAGACTDTLAPFGECDTTPTVIDEDNDGVANHLDHDSDGDGITDVFESGGLDSDGDGWIDGCVAVTALGRCLDSGGASLIVVSPINTDTTGLPDFLADDSDGDGISDATESRDTDGNAVLDGAETVATGSDTDGDGIDDAYDPDELGSDPLTPPFGAGSVEDSNGDGTPDWQQGCGDAYVTGTEDCDLGADNGTPGSGCDNSCALVIASDAGVSDASVSNDASVADAGTSTNDGSSGGLDAGSEGPPSSGCGCGAGDDQPAPVTWLFAVVILLAAHRRRTSKHC